MATKVEQFFERISKGKPADYINKQYRLLTMPKGTKMYLVVFNRVHTNLWVHEVEYQGFTPWINHTNWYEPKMSGPVDCAVQMYKVKFKYGKDIITINCDDMFRGTSKFGYEHITYGQGYESKLDLGVYGCVDTYFTDDPDRLRDFLKTGGEISTVNLPVSTATYIDMQIESLKKMKEDIQNSLKEIFEKE
jgi:hypothetical protein